MRTQFLHTLYRTQAAFHSVCVDECVCISSRRDLNAKQQTNNYNYLVKLLSDSITYNKK